jgi:hypothetical protein
VQHGGRRGPPEALSGLLHENTTDENIEPAGRIRCRFNVFIKKVLIFS